MCAPFTDIKRRLFFLAFRALNVTTNSNTGISPTTIVYGTFSKILRGKASTTTIKWTEVVRECTKIVSQIMAQETVKKARKQHEIPSEREMQTDTYTRLEYSCIKKKQRMEKVRAGGYKGRQSQCFITKRSSVFIFNQCSLPFYDDDKREDDTIESMEHSKRLRDGKEKIALITCGHHLKPKRVLRAYHLYRQRRMISKSSSNNFGWKKLKRFWTEASFLLLMYQPQMVNVYIDSVL